MTMADESTPLDGTLQLDRAARVFATNSDHGHQLEAAATVVIVAADQSHRPAAPCDLVIRRGNLRASERLPDGREVTRAVLQTGAVCRVRNRGEAADSGATDSPLYGLGSIVLVALNETEVWQLPPGTVTAE